MNEDELLPLPANVYVVNCHCGHSLMSKTQQTLTHNDDGTHTATGVPMLRLVPNDDGNPTR